LLFAFAHFLFHILLVIFLSFLLAQPIENMWNMLKQYVGKRYHFGIKPVEVETNILEGFAQITAAHCSSFIAKTHRFIDSVLLPRYQYPAGSSILSKDSCAALLQQPEQFIIDVSDMFDEDEDDGGGDDGLELGVDDIEDEEPAAAVPAPLPAAAAAGAKKTATAQAPALKASAGSSSSTGSSSSSSSSRSSAVSKRASRKKRAASDDEDDDDEMGVRGDSSDDDYVEEEDGDAEADDHIIGGSRADDIDDGDVVLGSAVAVNLDKKLKTVAVDMTVKKQLLGRGQRRQQSSRKALH
jgi:hypothetical protein